MLKIKRKQQRVLDLLHDKSIHTIVLIGAVGCFAKNTPVLTDSGYRNIQSIKIGDKVASFNGSSVTYNEVLASSVIRNNPKPMIELDYGNETIRSTYDHPFYDGEVYRPIYQLIWRNLDAGQRIQLKLLCKQYGQNIDHSKTWWVSHRDNETWERPNWTPKNSNEWQDNKSSSSSSSNLDTKSSETTNNQSQRWEPKEQSNRKPGVVYPQTQLSSRFKDGINISKISKTIGDSKSSEYRESEKDSKVVGQSNKKPAKDRKKEQASIIYGINQKISRDIKKCFEEYTVEARPIQSIRILESEPYYALSVDKVHTYIVGKNQFPVHNTGKTDIAACASIALSYKFPKTYWTVFRQNLSTAKRTVIPSYLNMLDMMNFEQGKHYTYLKQPPEIIMNHNQSRIVFVDADPSKDRGGKKIKGINATGNHIDEADELEEEMFNTAVSRRGRRNQSGQPSVSIVTMNPNDTYLKEKYYRAWREKRLPKGIEVVEFNIEDSWQSEQDIEAMRSNPKPWVERFINNNWDFQDDDLSLFKYRYFDAAITGNLDLNKKRFVGMDVARSGHDRSVIALWYEKTLVDIKIIKDHKDQKSTDEQAMELIKYCTQNGVTFSNVSIDAVGIGVGVIDHTKSKGISVRSFTSGGKPTTDKYNNLRSQVIYEFAQGLEKGKIKIYQSCPFRNELISEAMAHNHKIDAKKLMVESKEDVKKRTGSLSPDIMDAVVMGLHPQLDIDPKHNSNRILL